MTLLNFPALPHRPGFRLIWGQLYGSAAAWALANTVRAYSVPLLVITADTASASRLEQDLNFYLGASSFPVLNFPDWEILPYDIFSPHQDIISERLTVLHRLPNLTRGIVLAPIGTIMQRLPPREYLDGATILLDVGQHFARDAFRIRLEAAGYRAVNTVMERGEFAVRGSLFDLYPMGVDLPYRIDLSGDEIDSIHVFDPETQRSREKINSIRMLPAREFPLDEKGIDRFCTAWEANFGAQSSSLYLDVKKKLAPAGIEYYLPLFFNHTATLFDYLPRDTVVVNGAQLTDQAEAIWQEIIHRYEMLRHNVDRPLLTPPALYLRPPELFSGCNRYPRVIWHQEVQEDKSGIMNYATEPPPELPLAARHAQPLEKLLSFLETFPGRVLLIAESSGRREVLRELLTAANLNPTPVNNWIDFLESNAHFALTIAPLEHGLIVRAPIPFAVITERQLLGEQALQRRGQDRQLRDTAAIIRDLGELRPGVPVVHEQHGIGRYQGLQRLSVDGVDTEFLLIEYADGDKLYVPVAALHLVSRYSGADPEHAPLHKLGGGQWDKAKAKAEARVRDVAAELLDLYARRAARPGQGFSWESAQYRDFAAAFRFETTPDQQDAIDATLGDLAAPRPMDRVICGDVGFGKTEVALRAAFCAVQGGAQVALLTPTTLLAQQHYQTFSDRFADWPVHIEVLSRFRGKREQETVLNGLATGQVDIVIGTHKLLQDGITFKNLGLVIIDEEHRFGVRQKEAFKSLRSTLDILTLTATPIPRTLNMALSGLREISLITTPPARRIAIQTFIRPWNNELLREAMLREVKRGGQVYFLHNEVETINQIARSIAELLPEGTVQIAHGQMRARDLERVMLDFYHRRFNILLCTTIIETGIDVPSANTIIIHRADRFGLAQLYQLRGRVGRSHHRAYAYLLIPEQNAMTKDAIKRLEALEALTDLGVGFTLANHDMEIRGAGELLGEEQSGQMQEIGFTLYQDLLTRAVNALKSGKNPELSAPSAANTEIDLRLPALIPEDYVADINVRLILYKQIATAANTEQLRELQIELIDRFGLVPEATKNLFKIAELKLIARHRKIRKIELGTQGGRVIFNSDPNIDTASLIRLIQKYPQIYRFDGQEKLLVHAHFPDAASRFAGVEYLLKILAGTNEKLFPPPPGILFDAPRIAAEKNSSPRSPYHRGPNKRLTAPYQSSRKR